MPATSARGKPRDRARSCPDAEREQVLAYGMSRRPSQSFDDFTPPPALIGLILLLAVALAIAFLVAAQVIQTP